MFELSEDVDLDNLDNSSIETFKQFLPGLSHILSLLLIIITSIIRYYANFFIQIKNVDIYTFWLI